MKVTQHAAERFLQRVFQWKKYSMEQVIRARKLLTRDISEIKTQRSRVILPSFPNFVGIVKNNTLVTIVPKHH